MCGRSSADLSSDAAVWRVAAEAGELDILVNNAGAIPPGDLMSVDDERWRRAWDLKVFGYISTVNHDTLFTTRYSWIAARPTAPATDGYAAISTPSCSNCGSL
jgi:NAD(P)-dependent dehydrogenase (short-subunit alcohol dehydrogenase family)